MIDPESLNHCHGPIWQVDDISECVQRNYLKVVFPIAAVTCSFLLLVIRAISRSIASARLTTRGKISRETSAPLSFTAQEYEHARTTGARLVLTKATDPGSVAAIDAPRGQHLSTIVELLSIVALVIINVTALVIQAHGPNRIVPSVTGIITWAYIGTLVLARLTLHYTSWKIPRVWNHTATLYLLMWLFSLITFRSFIIHPRTNFEQAVLFTEFGLVTLLTGIAITTRKGNKAIVLEWENNIEPSREPLASLFSLITFGWVDTIVWKGYKKPFEMREIWNLAPKDKAAKILADYRQIKKTTALSFHLLRYFKKHLFIQCIFGVLSGIFTFAPTLLLKSILEYIQDPSRAPRNVIWLFVILLAFTDILRSLADGQALWLGRKLCLRLRTIIIGELYAKALRRKAASGNETVLGERKEKPSSKSGYLKRILDSTSKKCKNPDSDDAEDITNLVSNAKPVSPDEQANVGTIINLMSVDSFKVSEVTSYLHFLFAAAPTQLLFAVYLLYQILGYSSIPGILVIIILLPVNIMLARGFGRYQKKIMAATDKRIQTTNEVLQNIRVVKYFAWEHRFSKIVNDKRRIELKALRSKFILWACAAAVWNSVPTIITFSSFLLYTVGEKKPLYPSVAFTAISLFSILRVPLDQLGDMIAHVLESKVSVDRIEEFLNEEETEKYEQLQHEKLDDQGNKVIGFNKATFCWGAKEKVGNEASTTFCLMDLNVMFQVGELNIIAGRTGSGKTSLLMALLGEMTKIEGEVFLPGVSHNNRRPDPDTGLTDSVAYCAQQAWLVNANIKENILFAAPLNEKRYQDVIVACALERDLEILDAGDETLVGEKGITLSGGQKQRISLARALYSSSKHVLLDDCLSAVDPHTAKWIFEKCIRGPLMFGRTCILVTHNLALCVPQSKYVVLLDNGKIDIHGPSDEVIASGKLGDEVNRSMPASNEVSRTHTRAPSFVGDETDATLISGSHSSEDSVNQGKIKSNDVERKQLRADAMTESKAEGGVKLSVVTLYIKSMGSWWFWILAITVFGLQQLGTLGANAWIREWANQYQTYEIRTPHHLIPSNDFGSRTSATPLAHTHRFQPWISHGIYKSPFMAKLLPDVNIAYYLSIYAVIGLACMLLAFFRDLWLFFGSLTASKIIHRQLIHSVTRAKFKFFDVTPLGQIMNRFSKDLEAIDQEVAPISIGVLSCGFAIFLTVGLISFITPGFLIAAFFISIMYFMVGTIYLRSSRDLKRLESVQRSPLFQQFGETLNGITTIRAYGEERRFAHDNMVRINTHSRPFIYLWATNRWLAVRMDLIGDVVAFAAGAFVILSIGKVDAGSAGLSLSYAISFTENVLWLVRLYAMNEQNMNSVERIKEYLDVEQEAEAVIEATRPAANWPSEGSVEFIDYTTRYRKDLDPVLKNVSFKIKPGEKVGIVGRTGAGKSSLALALFRCLEAEKGKILIDDVDISSIGLQDLRESITIVPQDPTLFSGTIRSNLDPFNLFTDEDIFAALRRVQLIDSISSNLGSSASVAIPPPDCLSLTRKISSETLSATISTNKNLFNNLSSPVTESGLNLSQGQRQLLCLARALLKNPKVLLMDEATASIDYVTDSKIQETIRELTSTIITIAHRLQTIIDYDKVLVLDHGRVAEFGHPWMLLKGENPGNVETDSISNTESTAESHLFRHMCEMSGDLDILMKSAKKAWEASRLVDDE
ncbi:ABC transporter 7 [Podosphaera aphanis]|nr:ABC transporter 7 [Podosphaera aphanis]